MGSNKLNEVEVAAGFNLYIRAYVDESTEIPNLRWAPIELEGIKVGQGQTRDLGRIEFECTIPIYAEVVDSQGKPVEGVTVIHKCDKLIRKCWDNTDEVGLATFSAPRGSRGEFVVSGRKGEFNIWGPDNHQSELMQSINYELNGPEDANSVFTITVSDEMLDRLFE